jgi:hypothetical protein
MQRPNTDVMPLQALPRPDPGAQLARPETNPTVVQRPDPGAQLARPETSPTVIRPLAKQAAPAPAAAAPAPPRAPTAQPQPEGEDEATMVAAVPQDVLDQAKTGAAGELAEWKAVYDEFIKVKKQCNEPTEGLTFEKFQLTLKKNRDALIERHKCKRVKFTVYMKDGRASLKATPVKD